MHGGGDTHTCAGGSPEPETTDDARSAGPHRKLPPTTSLTSSPPCLSLCAWLYVKYKFVVVFYEGLRLHRVVDGVICVFIFLILYIRFLC